MTPKQSALSQVNSEPEGLPSLEEAKPWADPRESTVDFGGLKPWTAEDEQNAAMPHMDQVTPWEEPKAKPLPGPQIPDDDPGPPGVVGVMKSAFGRSVAERAMHDATGGQILLPKGVGGIGIEDQYQQGLATPETQRLCRWSAQNWDK